MKRIYVRELDSANLHMPIFIFKNTIASGTYTAGYCGYKIGYRNEKQ
jgi:hypothetical protein